jgi:hypothetical protein
VGNLLGQELLSAKGFRVLPLVLFFHSLLSFLNHAPAFKENGETLEKGHGGGGSK